MRLTDKTIKALQPEEKKKRHYDGEGLCLEVAPSGGKWWRLRYRFGGKEKYISLGVYPDVSLKEARDKAREARRLVADGIDPSRERRIKKENSPNSFETVAREWYEKQKNVVSKKVWDSNMSRFERFVFPFIGHRSIREVMPADILQVCRRIEAAGSTYNAHDVLSLCSRAFRYAIPSGYADSDPCRDLADALKPHQTVNTPTFTRRNDIRRLLLAIEAYNGSFVTRTAMGLLLLVFTRQWELRGAEWNEFDLSVAEWRIPASRMKMKEEHVVPLSRQAMEVIERLREVTGQGKYLFPSKRSPSRCMSENTINAALNYMGFDKKEIVGHGFRAMASTALNEMGWPADVIERQLAHTERNKVRAAYNRAAYMDERRKMMQAWADYLDRIKQSEPLSSGVSHGPSESPPQSNTIHDRQEG